MNTYFCFVIYGTDQKYYKGLVDNLEIISNMKPLPSVIINYDKDINEEYINLLKSISFVQLFKIEDYLLPDYKMCSRLLNIDNIPLNSYIFCRDADSRITKRDLWCIDEFIKSECRLHIIRDHYYHKQKIMGGMCGFHVTADMPNFKSIFLEFMKSSSIKKEYGFDEAFLSNKIYELFKADEIKIHSSIIGHSGEKISIIKLEHEDDYDFIGNVYNIDNNSQYAYSTYINYKHLQWLEAQNQLELILFNQKYISLDTYKWEDRQNIYILFLNAALKLGRLETCLKLASDFPTIVINDNIINTSNKIIELARQQNYNIIATSDINREPDTNELIIYYGNYPHSIECLPNLSRKIYRHPIYFKDIIHSRIEYNQCWNSISTIYILNLEERVDRYYNILVELCKVHAPLDRIYHYKAQKTSYTGDRQQDAYIGATINHLEVAQHFIKSHNETCLVLEDDITFISNITKVFDSLTVFFNKSIEYDICFLAYSKYGDVRRYDEDLLLSYQLCTTSSAYLLNKTYAPLIESSLKTGVDEMIAGKSPNIYCCDRYWAILQKRNKMFLFKNKLAFQAITYSDIVKSINYTFD